MLAGNEFAEWLGVRDLHDEIRALEGSGYDTTRLRVAFHRQIAEVVVPLVMVVLGLPFAFRVGRRGSLYGVGVALVLVLLYWATWAIANGLGLQDLVPPAIAAWGPNVLWAAGGSSLLLTARSWGRRQGSRSRAARSASFDGRISSALDHARRASLVVSDEGWPASLEVAARAADDRTVMALRHRQWPVHGVQFHPESIMTVEGRRMLRNFMEL